MDLLQRAERHVGERKSVQLPGVTLSMVDMDPARNEVGWLEGSHRCLHLDFAQEYLDRLDSGKSIPPGISNIRSADVKVLCHKMFREATTSDDVSEASLHTLSLDILSRLFLAAEKRGRPAWVPKLEEILRNDYSDKLSLDALSRELGIHPVHLSRSVSRYFHCTLGEYVRKVRVERSLAFMPLRNLSLTEISSRCGFADQSHFVRSFKRIMGTSPSAYRKLLGC